MTTEMIVLCLSVVLGFVHLVLATGAATKVYGIKWNLSSRGETKPPLQGMAGRLGRAFENFKETFPFFLASVFALQFFGKNSTTSAWGAEIYLCARVLYLPIYAFDVTIVRTLLWLISCVGILIILGTAMVG
jgi:uncharacterized MAPEG superfamily protein